MFKKTALLFLLFGCLQGTWSDPWNRTPRGHREAAKKSAEEARHIKRTVPKSPYRTVLVNIHNKEAALHKALAEVDQIQNKTALAVKRRNIQDNFRALGGLHSEGARLAPDHHSKAVHRRMASASHRATGFGSANRLNRIGVFSSD